MMDEASMKSTRREIKYTPRIVICTSGIFFKQQLNSRDILYIVAPLHAWSRQVTGAQARHVRPACPCISPLSGM